VCGAGKKTCTFLGRPTSKGVRSGPQALIAPLSAPSIRPARAGWTAPFPERKSGCAESPGSDAAGAQALARRSTPLVFIHPVELVRAPLRPPSTWAEPQRAAHHPPVSSHLPWHNPQRTAGARKPRGQHHCGSSAQQPCFALGRHPRLRYATPSRWMALTAACDTARDRPRNAPSRQACWCASDAAMTRAPRLAQRAPLLGRAAAQAVRWSSPLRPRRPQVLRGIGSAPPSRFGRWALFRGCLRSRASWGPWVVRVFGNAREVCALVWSRGGSEGGLLRFLRFLRFSCRRSVR